MSAPPTESGFALLGDHPETGPNDALGFDQVAEQLADMLLASEAVGPFTLGIEAGWGKGKSSLMRHIERELVARAGTKKVVPVWFNAWTAEGDDVLEGLIKSVLAEIDPSALRRTLRNKQLVSWLRLAVMVVAQWLKLGDVVNVFWEKTGTDVRTRNELQQLVETAITEWAKRSPAPEGRMIVVFIDDLDRCSPDNVFRVFEAVKLYLATPQFVFVIGFDQTVISQAILREKKYADAETGRSYLEKVVQMEFPIPRPSDEQIDTLTGRYLDASGTTEIIDAAAKSLVVELNDRNPRRIKRFINWFVLEHRLDQGAGQLSAELLVTALIIHLYFYDFRRLFELDGNPIEDFKAYRHVVGLRGKAVGDDAVARAAFASAGLDTPDVIDDDVLAELEKKLPTEFKVLVDDARFVSLVGELKEEQRTQLSLWLSRKSPVAKPAEPGEPAANLTGLQVLWVDDRPHSVREARDLVARHGARIIAVTSGEEAESMLGESIAEVLVSDINRGGIKDRGFMDVRRWRSTGQHSGPVVFYTTKVTPERIDTAHALGAEICKTPQALVSTLAAIQGKGRLASWPGGARPVQPRPRARPVLDVPRTPAVPMIGRRTELEEALRALRDGRHVQITGERGSGKTVLLRVLVNTAEAHLPDGAVYISHRGASIDDVQLELFQALFEADWSYQPSVEEIRTLLRGAEVLVALDEPEFGNAEIAELIRGLPRSRFALARRTPYALDGPATTIELRPLDRDAAMELFEAQLGRPLAPAERPMAERLVTSAEGRPLGIMHAAAAVRNAETAP